MAQSQSQSQPRPLYTIRAPVPTIEETARRLGVSQRRVDEIVKIMSTPVPRRKVRTTN
jgi:hypothetical protein